MKVLSIILFTIILSANAWTAEQIIKNCSELQDSCEYYLCIENQKQCGNAGYLKSFGHKYCHRFEKYTSNSISDHGKKWLDAVRSCLIREMTQMDPNLSCNQLKRQAFNTHYACYVETKFCNLSYLDKYKIIRAVGRGFRNSQVLRTGIRVLRSCRFIRFY